MDNKGTLVERLEYLRMTIEKDAVDILNNKNYKRLEEKYAELLSVASQIEASGKNIQYKSAVKRIEKQCPPAFWLFKLGQSERKVAIQKLSEEQCVKTIKELKFFKVDLKESFVLDSMNSMISEFKFKLNQKRKTFI